MNDIQGEIEIIYLNLIEVLKHRKFLCEMEIMACRKRLDAIRSNTNLKNRRRAEYFIAKGRFIEISRQINMIKSLINEKSNS